MRECKTLEFKSDISNTFLKTVSAYANYNGGQILFGVDDNGNSIGIDNPTQACLDIENKINDTIKPQPQYELNIQESTSVIKLTVEAGRNTPYMYKSKAYRRNDSSTVEVDDLELGRLILRGKNINYESLKAAEQNLSFNELNKNLKDKLHIDNLDQNILKSLGLYNDIDGFNHAAELLSDRNSYPGIDIAKFGESINIIQKRKRLEHMSIIEELNQAVFLYKDYYQYEEIDGMNRITMETVPEAAYREAIANALIHRTWDINAYIRVFMFDDRIEITSPGGLPSGLSETEYLNGNVSVLRNPIIGNIFYRLNLVEILGTGVIRIKDVYKNSLKKPTFEIYDNSIKITLPTINELDLSNDEYLVYKILTKNTPKSISEITKNVPFGKSKTTDIIKRLIERKYVISVGTGRGTKYKL